MVDHLPDEQVNLIKSRTIIANDFSISAGCIILPKVTKGEGAIFGANSLVNKDLEP